MTRFAWMEAPAVIPEEQLTRTETADIVIVGAGHAGTCAARGAAECGASVIVLEQQPEEKQWVLGMGEIGHINSRWQKEHGVGPVDIDEFVNDWQLRTNNRSDYRLIRTYAEQCGDCFDWFIEPLTQEERDGIHPMLTPPSPHMPKALNGFRAWPGTPNMGVALMTRAVKENQHIAKEHGARFFFGTRACQLTKENGAVTGVVGQLPGGEYVQFRAKKGVILAAGDYSKNPDMCRDLLSEADDLSDGDITGHGWDGSGIRMGVWAGGRLEPRSHAAMGGNYSFPGFDLIGSAATLRVNCHGKRYSNEGFGTHILAATTGAKQPNGMLWGIFDSNIRDELTYQAPNHAVFDYTDPAEIEKLEHSLAAANKTKGNAAQIKDKAGAVRPLYCADTLEELAGILFAGHADRENFLRTVERYNEMCRCGQDKDFGKDPALLHPVQKPPFYACGNRKDSHQPGGQSLKLLVTVSGLLIDENQQVLDHDFEPISGLYATGNCSGCRFGFQYTTSLPGQSISIAQTLGRILGSRLAGKEIS
ncbi:MAG: FAD-dependent oxidoreductase [Lachnospiraceae bacterium]|nr:FAD-dependent oxidoreductase [Lachnospiraceae bacterium]